MLRSLPGSLLIVSIGLWAGCSDVAPAPPAGDGAALEVAEAATVVDVTSSIDATTTVDVTSPLDVATTPDVAAPLDAPARPDARPDAPAAPDAVDPPELRYARLRVAAVNAPETARAELLSPPLARAQRLLGLLAEDEVDAAAVQESGTYLRRAAGERPGWSSTWAPPNNVVGEREVGNGIVYRGAPLAILDEASLRVPMPGRPRGLNFPVRIFEHRADADRRARFVMISFHAPTRRDDPDDTTRAAVRRSLLAYARRCQRAGLPVVLAGDANDGDYASHFRGDLEAAFHHGVDWVLVSPEVRVHGGSSRAIPLLSDHDAIVATVSVPARSDTPRRLPE
jgi:hypothetical protein